MSKQKPAATKQAEQPIFTLRVFNPRAMTRAIESAYVQRAMQLASQEFRSTVGTKLKGQIVDGYSVVLGEWEYQPAADAA
jgi:hypothetical protein